MTADSATWPSALLEAEGHLVDSQVLARIFDKVVEHGARFEVQRFDIGRTNDDPSYLTLKVAAADEASLSVLLEELIPLGCRPTGQEQDVVTRPAPQDGCAPDEFYSTTNHRTYVRTRGRWLDVGRQRMDAAIVLEQDGAVCRKLRDLKAGDAVVCGVEGIRVVPDFRERDRLGFAFMSNDVSSERRVEITAARVADMLKDVRQAGGRIAFVAGPVIVHTGGVEYFGQLIRCGYVNLLLSGNALAVHDIELALYGTSLGINLAAGSAVEAGHQHHMRAINAVNRAGGIRAAVEKGLLRSGIMYECVTHGVDYVLAGSIRDDGPILDTEMNLVIAQNRYSEALAGVQMVVMLSSMLHSIGVGNMLPSWVRVICVDINPAVVTKLADRGSAQTIGIVTDVGLFLHQLARHLS
jgi:arginine dihydrolase